MHGNCKGILSGQYLRALVYPLGSVISSVAAKLLQGKFPNGYAFSGQVGLVHVDLSVEKNNITKKLILWDEDISGNEFSAGQFHK